MKKCTFVVIALILLSASVTYAQPKKGDWMVGVNVNPFSIKGGLFLSNRDVIGLDVWPAFSRNVQTKTTGFNLSVNAFVRHYFAPKEGMQSAKFYFFGDFSVGYQGSYNYDGFNKVGSTGGNMKTGIAPGIVYFINNRVSIDAALRLNYYADLKNWSHVSTTPEVGIQVYLQGKKKATAAAE